MPWVDILLDVIGVAQFVSTIDLNKGYWQITLLAEDKEKTAFANSSGLYRFTKRPFWNTRGVCLFPAGYG